MSDNKILYDPRGHKLIDIPEGIKTKSFVVIDLDYICFKVAAVLEEKSVQIYGITETDGDNYLIGTYKNRTEYKKSEEYIEDYIVKDCQELKKDYKSSMTFLLRKFIEDIRKATKSEEVVLAAGGTTNFRDRLPSPQKYKGNRDDVLKPLALKECKEYAANTYITVRGEDEEADDIISMFQYRSYYDKIYKIVVATPDKDSLQTQGYLYNPESSKGMALNSVDLIEGLGKVSLIEKPKKMKLHFKGRIVVYCQAFLLGDSTDNYQPCANYKALNAIDKQSSLLTEKKVYELLKDCTTDKECLSIIHNIWLDWYKDIKGWKDYSGNWVEGDYIDLMQIYWDLAFMRRFPNDKVCVRTMLKNLGILNDRS